MLKNLFKIAIRNIIKEKSYSIINVLGLAIGMTSAIFLTLYVLDELSYDRFHENADKIYRVNSNITEPNKSFNWNSTQVPTGPTITEEYPVVENYARFFPRNRTLFKYEDQNIYEQDVYAADSTVFDVFTFPFIEGQPQNALNKNNSLVITKKLATKLFGEQPALGKLIGSENNQTFEVTGVIEDIPLNSHLQFEALISVDPRESSNDNWGGFYVLTYLVLPSGYNVAELNSQLGNMYTKYMENIFGEMGIKIQYELQKITDIHLHSNIEGEGGGDISYIYIFSIVAAFMILIACINYMNLSTARSVHRAKEVGIRKVMGSVKSQLIIQFLSESVILSFIALLISILFIFIALPYFNEVSGKEIEFSMVFSGFFPFAILAVTLLAGLLGGSYPALVMSSFKPVSVLKGKVISGKSNIAFRKILVILQFSISLVMVVCTKIVYDQLDFLQNKDLGYNREQVMVFNMPRAPLNNKYEILKHDLIADPNILNIASAGNTAGNIGSRVILELETNEGMDELAVKPFMIDHDFLKTMKIDIVQGRNFSEDIKADTTNGFIVNETLVKLLNWDNPIGKRMVVGGSDEEPVYAQVIGVVKDFHPVSLYEKIEPMVLFYRLNNRAVHVKVNANNISTTISSIENKWKEVFPTIPFDYDFLDQDFLSAYQADVNRGKIFTTFAILTIFIACLGLLGLASYTAENRTKEIGIRKVIGATIINIVLMISRDFVILIAISMVIAFPLAYYFMDNWLEIFAYKTEIKWLSFVIAALLTFGITITTVSYHTIRAATRNPIKSLRSE
ncbi:ABC transporter permease [Chondrinema litorale]|uniref:ABC transporter permease n=1 Tax=Chondrinema litorale TaxID=2994555 RepID=UPI0025442CBB|nr:ABC transporter permease [Chondrinema litorale]UZR93708.1 ABC transporter permease [Chondrinema litorale]